MQRTRCGLLLVGACVLPFGLGTQLGQHAIAANMTNDAAPAHSASMAADTQQNQSRLAALGKRLDNVNKAYLFFGSAAALSGLLTLGCSFFIYRWSNEKGVIEAQITDDKDRQLALFQTEAAVKISAAQAEAADANRAAEVARKDAANATERTAELASANLKLEAEIAPRRITAYQLTPASPLAPVMGRTVRVQSYSLDVESAMLAKQIVSMLSTFRFQVQDGSMSVGSFGSLAIGIHVSGKDPQLAAALVATFKELNLMVTSGALPPAAGISSEVPGGEPDALVFVGVKPLSP